jgi:hypothetical protein
VLLWLADTGYKDQFNLRGRKMLVWCMTLFGLGVLAFLDTIFNYGEIFRRVNSILFMLLSLGLLVRTRMLIKFGKLEALLKQSKEHENQTTQTTESPVAQEKKKEPEKVY